MTETIVTQNKLRRIEDLSLKEIDMTYSLSRCGWSYKDIGRKYGISENDARTVANNYEALRKICELKPPEERQNQNLEPATERPRKRRHDAVYATAKDRQAAYRARLREKHRAVVEEPTPSASTDSTGTAQAEPAVTLCHDPASETVPDDVDPQHSAGAKLLVNEVNS